MIFIKHSLITISILVIAILVMPATSETILQYSRRCCSTILQTYCQFQNNKHDYLTIRYNKDRYEMVDNTVLTDLQQIYKNLKDLENSIKADATKASLNAPASHPVPDDKAHKDAPEDENDAKNIISNISVIFISSIIEDLLKQTDEEKIDIFNNTLKSDKDVGKRFSITAYKVLAKNHDKIVKRNEDQPDDLKLYDIVESYTTFRGKNPDSDDQIAEFMYQHPDHIKDLNFSNDVRTLPVRDFCVAAIDENNFRSFFTSLITVPS